MDLIEIIKALLGVVVSVLCYYAKKQNEDIKKMQEGLHCLELKSAEHYANKADIDALTKAIFTKLDRIEDKIDKKADK